MSHPSCIIISTPTWLWQLRNDHGCRINPKLSSIWCSSQWKVNQTCNDFTPGFFGILDIILMVQLCISGYLCLLPTLELLLFPVRVSICAHLMSNIEPKVFHQCSAQFYSSTAIIFENYLQYFNDKLPFSSRNEVMLYVMNEFVMNIALYSADKTL